MNRPVSPVCVYKDGRRLLLQPLYKNEAKMPRLREDRTNRCERVDQFRDVQADLQNAELLL